MVTCTVLEALAVASFTSTPAICCGQRRRDLFGGIPGGYHPQDVVSRCQTFEMVLAGAIRRCMKLLMTLRVRQRDAGIADDRTIRIRRCALQPTAELRKRGRNEQCCSKEHSHPGFWSEAR